MSLDDSSHQAVYDSALQAGENSEPVKLTTEKSKLSVQKYEWQVSCEPKPDEHKFIITATMSSRYKFSDTLILNISLKKSGKRVKFEAFDLKKTFEKQEFEILYEEEFDNIYVKAVLLIRSINYCTDKWATESDFLNSNRAHDVVLIVGEEKFYVHRVYLATWFRYFDRLFFGDFKEKNQKEIVLKDIRPDDFFHVLQYMHPQMFWPFGDYSVRSVLALADRLEISNLMARCGIILSNFDRWKKVSLMERLELGDKHNLVHLQVACFECIHAMSLDDRNKFFEENRERIQELSEMTVKNLI